MTESEYIDYGNVTSYDALLGSCFIVPLRESCKHVLCLQPAVCARDLCVFSFQTLGVMSDAAEDIATQPEVRYRVSTMFFALFTKAITSIWPSWFAASHVQLADWTKIKNNTCQTGRMSPGVASSQWYTYNQCSTCSLGGTTLYIHYHCKRNSHIYDI